MYLVWYAEELKGRLKLKREFKNGKISGVTRPG
jgi:hypothetical protein